MVWKYKRELVLVRKHFRLLNVLDWPQTKIKGLKTSILALGEFLEMSQKNFFCDLEMYESCSNINTVLGLGKK